MKLCTFELESGMGRIHRTGVLVSDNQVLDINLSYAFMLEERDNHPSAKALANVLVPADMLGIVDNGEFALKAIRETLDYFADRASDINFVSSEGAKLVRALDSVKLLAPIPKPRSLRDTVGFLDHIRGAMHPNQIPDVYTDLPGIYYKGNVASIVGPDVDIEWPSYEDTLDYELEIALIIGRKGKNIAESDAMAHVFGYTVFNDISARDRQYKEMGGMLGPAKGKDFDTGNVMGPVLVTADEFNPYEDHLMLARVNGEEWSRGSIKTMDFGFASIISYISQHETLYPGDILGSGTVATGCGAELGKFPQPGDVIELEVEGIGVLRNKLIRR